MQYLNQVLLVELSKIVLGYTKEEILILEGSKLMTLDQTIWTQGPSSLASLSSRLFINESINMINADGIKTLSNGQWIDIFCIRFIEWGSWKYKQYEIIILNNDIFCIGGVKDDKTTNAVFKFDENNNIYKLSLMNHARQNHHLILFNSVIFAIGGEHDNTMESYNPLTDTWTLMDNMSCPRTKSNSKVLVFDKYIFIFGFNSTIERYSPGIGFEVVGKTSKRDFGLIIDNEDINIIGGFDNNKSLKNSKRCYAFDTYSFEWKKGIKNQGFTYGKCDTIKW